MIIPSSVAIMPTRAISLSKLYTYLAVRRLITKSGEVPNSRLDASMGRLCWEINACIINHIPRLVWYIVSLPCPMWLNSNGSLITPPLKLWYRWVIAPYGKMDGYNSYPCWKTSAFTSVYILTSLNKWDVAAFTIPRHNGNIVWSEWDMVLYFHKLPTIESVNESTHRSHFKISCNPFCIFPFRCLLDETMFYFLLIPKCARS